MGLGNTLEILLANHFDLYHLSITLNLLRMAQHTVHLIKYIHKIIQMSVMWLDFILSNAIRKGMNAHSIPKPNLIYHL